jgi:hypothetical protein
MEMASAKYERNLIGRFHAIARNRTDTLLAGTMVVRAPLPAHADQSAYFASMSWAPAPVKFVSSDWLASVLVETGAPYEAYQTPRFIATSATLQTVFFVTTAGWRLTEDEAREFARVALDGELVSLEYGEPNVVAPANSISSPLQYTAATLWNWLTPFKKLGYSNLTPITWHSVSPLLREQVLAFYPLGLPAYVLLWIFQNLEPFCIQRDHRMIALIQGVIGSCRRVLRQRDFAAAEEIRVVAYNVNESHADTRQRLKKEQ